MSVVAAISSELVHTNRRRNGSWTQRYEHGIPVTELIPIANDGTTGTSVRFTIEPSLAVDTATDAARLRELTAGFAKQGLTVRVAEQAGR